MAAAIDLSSQDDRIVDALAANLHVIYFHAPLTDAEKHALAVKTIKIAVQQSSVETIELAMSRLHSLLRDNVAASEWKDA